MRRLGVVALIALLTVVVPQAAFAAPRFVNEPAKATFDDSTGYILVSDTSGSYIHSIQVSGRGSHQTMTGLYVVCNWLSSPPISNPGFRIDTFHYGSARYVSIRFDQASWKNPSGDDGFPSPIASGSYDVDVRIWPKTYSSSWENMVIGARYECESWCWLYGIGGSEPLASLSHYIDHPADLSSKYHVPNDLIIKRTGLNAWSIDSSAYFEYYTTAGTQGFCKLIFHIEVSKL